MAAIYNQCSQPARSEKKAINVSVIISWKLFPAKLAEMKKAYFAPPAKSCHLRGEAQYRVAISCPVADLPMKLVSMVGRRFRERNADYSSRFRTPGGNQASKNKSQSCVPRAHQKVWRHSVYGPSADIHRKGARGGTTQYGVSHYYMLSCPRNRKLINYLLPAISCLPIYHSPGM